jgi:hypothetical protein
MSADDATTRRALDPFGFPPGVTFLFVVLVVVAEIVVLRRAGATQQSFGTTALHLVELGVGAVLAYGVVGAVYRARLRRSDPALAAALDARDRAAREAAAAQAAADERTRNAYAQGPLAPVSPGHGIVTLPGETFYWTCEDVRLIGDREHRVFRRKLLAPGLAEDERHWDEELDRGMLALSDRRVLLVGNQQPRPFPFESIVVLTPRDDGFVLAVADTPPFTFVTGRREDGVVVQRLMRGDIGSHEPAAQP